MEQFAYTALGVVGSVMALLMFWQFIKSHPRMVCPKCAGKGEFKGFGGFKDCPRCKRDGRVLRTSLRVASFLSTNLKQRYADIRR